MIYRLLILMALLFPAGRSMAADCSALNVRVQESISSGNIEKLRENLDIIKTKDCRLWDMARNDLLITFTARTGRLDMISLLLEYGININSKTKEGKTALSFALADNDTTLIRFLLDNGAAVFFESVLIPIENNSPELISLLLPYYKETDGLLFRYLQYKDAEHSAGESSEDIVKMSEFLIDSGADPDYKNSLTPLTLLASRYAIDPQSRLDLVELLIEKGADPNFTADGWISPLWMAAGRSETRHGSPENKNFDYSDNNYKLAKLLLDKGATQFIVDRGYFAPPVFIALASGNFRIFLLLAWKFVVAYILIILFYSLYKTSKILKGDGTGEYAAGDFARSAIWRFAKLFGPVAVVGMLFGALVVFTWLRKFVKL